MKGQVRFTNRGRNKASATAELTADWYRGQGVFVCTLRVTHLGTTHTAEFTIPDDADLRQTVALNAAIKQAIQSWPVRWSRLVVDLRLVHLGVA